MPDRPDAVAAAQAWLEQHEQELIDDLRAVLQIESLETDAEPNAPFGPGNREALDFVLNKAEEWGMATKDVEGYAGHAEFGEGDKLVMILGHLDVVPVSDGWKHAPFDAEIDGDYLYARGAVDDKGPTMAAFYALRALKETGADLPCRMRAVFGCNEESGFKCVERYFQTEEAPTYGIAPDSGWPLYNAEKGIANLIVNAPFPKGDLSIISMNGGSRPNIVIDKFELTLEFAPEMEAEIKEKTADYWDKNVAVSFSGNRIGVTATGKAAHGSTPFMGDSAFTRAMRYALAIAPPEHKGEYDAWLMLGHPGGVGIAIDGRDDPSEDLTANVGVVRTEGDAARVTVNIRYPVTWKGADVEARAKAKLEKDGFGWKVSEFDDSEPLFFPADREPVLTILEAYREETGDMTPPRSMGGGTYARAVPNTVSVGTGWDGDGPAHENDERIHISHPLKMAKIYVHILYRLAKLTEE
jgi:succinyl-diaminopimelate desuccinylase